jgi:LemA protein
MKKGLLIALGVVVLLVFYTISKYNGLVSADENVKNGWADVQADYQRRADLIPSLIATVKKAAENEKDILTTVTNARAGISNLEKEAADNETQIKNAKTPQELDAIGQRVNSAIKITLEAYPSIRSTDAFIGLQGQLEGTENRIKTSRSDYNAKVKLFNIAARSFPNNIIAGMFGFSVKEEFKATEGSDKAPDVKALFE